MGHCIDTGVHGCKCNPEHSAHRRTQTLGGESRTIPRIERQILSRGVLNSLGQDALTQVEYQRATSFFTEFQEVAQSVSDSIGIANLIYNLGQVALHEMNYSGAYILFHVSLSKQEAMGKTFNTAMALVKLSLVALF